jgi:hypothetical protein
LLEGALGSFHPLEGNDSGFVVLCFGALSDTAFRDRVCLLRKNKVIFTLQRKLKVNLKVSVSWPSPAISLGLQATSLQPPPRA